jgi:ketosteroid isomerase-like protein
MARSGTNAFLALWRAYGEGRLERSLDLVDPACELIMLDGARIYHGHPGVREWLADARRWTSLTVTFDDVREPRQECVVASGEVVGSAADGSRPFERRFGCVAEFRAGRLTRGRVFSDFAAALRFAGHPDDAPSGGG